MVLIKVSDISNEARPMDVAEPWLDRLLQEFFKQSDAEKLEGLPVTPFMDREKITKPSSQCSFIGFVLLPLFEALGELLTELQVSVTQLWFFTLILTLVFFVYCRISLFSRFGKRWNIIEDWMKLRERKGCTGRVLLQRWPIIRRRHKVQIVRRRCLKVWATLALSWRKV